MSGGKIGIVFTLSLPWQYCHVHSTACRPLKIYICVICTTELYVPNMSTTITNFKEYKTCNQVSYCSSRTRKLAPEMQSSIPESAQRDGEKNHSHRPFITMLCICNANTAAGLQLPQVEFSAWNLNSQLFTWENKKKSNLTVTE